jgi:hypothetical protein
MSSYRLTSISVAVVASIAATHATQGPRVLDKPQVEIAEPFTNVSAVRELSDGRLIVVDAGNQSVHLVDFKTRSVEQIGRAGSGPGEYKSPGTLLALGGDTTWVADPGNARLLEIGPNAKPTRAIADAWPLADGRPGTRLPRGIDARGRGYLPGRAVNTRPGSGVVQADSSALIRSARGSTAEDTLGYIHLSPRKIDIAQSNGAIRSVSIIIPPFPSQDGWVVFPDGSVALVRTGNYRVDWVLTDGRRVAGRAIPFTPVRVTDADKKKRAPAAPEPDWPEMKPPFVYAGVLAGADGNVWIPRYASADDTRSHYDVIDRRGAIVAQVDVPNLGKVVGFGTKSIYVVRIDDDDLQYLQRFPL